MSYFDGFVTPVPADKKQDYIDLAVKMAAVFKENGMVRMVEAWGDDVPEGKTTDFRMAVKAEEGEIPVFSFIEWPSKEARDAGMKAVMEHPMMQVENMEMPFDGKRMIYGGFAGIVDEK